MSSTLTLIELAQVNTHIVTSPCCDAEEINDIAVTGGDHKFGVAEFTDENKKQVDVYKARPDLLYSPVEQDYQSIAKYFERPRLYQSTTVNAARANIVVHDVSDPVRNYFPAAAVNRLIGAYGYRCTIKYTITMAATPFQQSLVCASFQYGTATVAGAQISRHRYPAAVTNLPHVRLNPETGTMVELVVPYISKRDYFEYQNGAGVVADSVLDFYGTFALTQILPYVTLAGSTPPTIRVYVSLHDFSFFGATPLVQTSVVTQSNIEAIMDTEKSPYKGLVSKPLKTLASISEDVTSIGGKLGIPIISRGSTLVGWFARKLAHTAESFGFSKPIVEKPSMLHLRQNYVGDHHVETPNTAFVLSPYQSNCVAAGGDATISDLDEMSLPFALGHFSQIYAGRLLTTDPIGTVFYAASVSPFNWWFKDGSSRAAGTTTGNTGMFQFSNVGNALIPSSLLYWTSMFRFWRGSVVYRISFSKTRFHAGRLMLSFVPSVNELPEGGTLDNNVPSIEVNTTLPQPSQYSMIIDLKQDSVFEFEIPFVCARPWLNLNSRSGGVTMAVIDPLIASGETAGQVNFLIEIAAGKDYDVAAYTGSGLAPINTTAPNNIVTLQSGLADLLVDDVTQHTSGEKYSSIKELIQIPYMMAEFVASNTSLLLPLPQWNYGPLMTVANPFSDAERYFNALSVQNQAASCYTFATGGTIYHAYSESTGVDLRINVNPYGPNGPPLVRDPRFRPAVSIPRIYANAGLPVHAKLPAYQKFKKVPATQYWAANWDPGLGLPFSAGNIDQPVTATLKVRNNDSFLTNFYIGIAAADDATLSGYIGPPPILIRQATATNCIDRGHELLRDN